MNGEQSHTTPSLTIKKAKKLQIPLFDWSEYLIKFNTIASKAGAVICDSVLVIDCDTQEAAERFLKLANIPNVETIEDLTREGVDDKLGGGGIVIKTPIAKMPVIFLKKRKLHFFFKFFQIPTLLFCMLPWLFLKHIAFIFSNPPPPMPLR